MTSTWSTSSSSRTPTAPMLSKERADVTAAREPLHTERRGEGGGGRGGGRRQRAEGRGGGIGCFACCARRGGHGRSVGDKDKNKKSTKAGGKYTATSTDNGNKDQDMESGISCLSRYSDIPRVDGDGDVITTAGSTNQGKQLPAAPDAKQKCGRWMRKFVQFLCSFVGLTLFMAAYSIGGGFLFEYLEKDHEFQVNMDVVKTRANAVDALWNTTVDLNVFHEDIWKAKAHEAMRNFQKELYDLTTKGWVGADEAFNTSASWNFYSAFLYSITVTTTIGYGNVTPKTQLARIITVLYAIVGIPLCLLWLSTLGSYMAVGLRFLYFQICRCCTWICSGCCKKRRRPQRGKETKLEEGIGGGKNANSKAKDSNPRQAKFSAKTQTVPCYVCLPIIFLYLVLGAWLFSQWEGWSYLDAGYFCFITISTIGFGDFVPGAGYDAVDKGKTIGNAAYLVVGLALVAMCFQLMQEDVKKTCQSCMKGIRMWTNGERSVGSKGKVLKSKEGKSGSGGGGGGGVEESEEGVDSLKWTKEDQKKVERERAKAKKEEEKTAKEEKKRLAQAQRDAQKADKKAKESAKKTKKKDSNPRASTTANSPKMAMACESPRYSQNPTRPTAATTATTTPGAAMTQSMTEAVESRRQPDGRRRLSNEFQTSPTKRPMSKDFQSMRTLTLNHSEDEFDTRDLRERGRVNTISGSLANQRYYDEDCCGYMSGEGEGCGGERGLGVGRKFNPGCAKPNNNNTTRLSNMNNAEMSARPGCAVPHPHSSHQHPHQSTSQGLPQDTVDLLEHMAAWSSHHPSPHASPKMTRRDRSRSPVRGRPRSRAAMPEDRGGNVDVATEDEEDGDDNDDDDDDDDDETLDGTSVASSTDLIKVAQAVRRERQEGLPPPPASPANTSFSTGTASPLPAFTHPTNNAAMTTFRPPPAGGNCPAVLGGMYSPPPATASRPPSRCHSRAKSIASPLTYFQQGYDVMPPPFPPNFDVMQCMSPCPQGYDVMNPTSRPRDYDVMSTSTSSSRPKDYDIISVSSQPRYDVISASPRPVSSASSRPSSAEGEGEEGESVYGDNMYRESNLGSPDAEMVITGQGTFIAKPRPPSSMAGRLPPHGHDDFYEPPPTPQWLQHQQLQQLQPLPHHNHQQQQQPQQWHQQRPPSKQCNKVYSSGNTLPPRCVSPRPKANKTAQHEGQTSPPTTEEEFPPPPSPAVSKTKKMPIGAF